MRAKKSLGQNFLKSKEALRLMITAADIQVGDTILEIGPGKGVLTTELLAKTGNGKVVAIEKDDGLAVFLKEKFSSEIATGKLELVHGDILNLEPEDLGLAHHHYKIVANIPYYITGTLFKKFLEGEVVGENHDHQPERMVLLVQKEVAERIVAKNHKESILSISVKAYGTPRYVKTVKAKYFSPQPKVDSAIISIENISKDFFYTASDNLGEKTFFEVLKTGFAHKRKMLKGNLSQKYKNVEEVFRTLGLDQKIRAENVGVEEWKLIAQNIQE